MKASLVRFARPAFACSVLLAAGCSADGRDGFGSNDTAGVVAAPPPPAPTASAASSGNPAFADAGGDAGPTKPVCAAETQFIYLVDGDGKLYKFEPTTLVLTPIGPITCATGGVYSMAVDRNAFAWIVADDGHLLKVNTRDASCVMTSFVPQQNGFALNFGMGFSSNSPGSEDETLFVSDTVNPGLATIDTKTLVLTKVGKYDKSTARAELTGTGDARLFGAFEGTPYVVSEIAKTNAAIESQAPQSAISYAPSSSNFAFAAWGGEFFLFVGPGTSTDVFRYNPTTSKTVKVKAEAIKIVGAGVSTCAPTVPK